MRLRIGRLADSTFSAPAERHTILREWNDTAHPIPPATLPELFEAQVARTPDAVAVVFEEQSLTYAELNARANQLAHYLIGKGVGPEVVVGLCVERSLEMVVGLIGILKAGGAYLPLDPGYPPERLAFMLADAKAPCWSRNRPCSTGCPRTALRPCVSMPTGQPSRSNPRPLPAIRLLPNNPAYVIYTSGSTGKPKGVAVTHQEARTSAYWRIRALIAITGADDVCDSVHIPVLRRLGLGDLLAHFYGGSS